MIINKMTCPLSMFNKINCPIMALNFKETFEQLTDDEKAYTYYLSKACWAGAPIVLFQKSYESPALFIIFQKFFSSFQPFKELKKQILQKSNSTITDVEYKQFITYAAKFYANFGNYSSFGKKMFIPELPLEKFEDILNLSPAFNEFNFTWKCIRYIIYDNKPNLQTINLEEKGGKNSYYLGGINEEQITKIDSILHEKKINPLNTRLLMRSQKKYVVLVSSIEEKNIELSTDPDVVISYGEFAAFLKQVNDNLLKAKSFAANETQEKMLDLYIESFQTGNIEKHKESQKEWIKDKLPVIEMNIGWIETGMDPMGVRGHYEGWVALTDQWKSEKYATLVANSKKLLDEMPWPSDFENEKFVSPDFVALDTVCFASDGCPIGKNIPHYEDIQNNEGSKIISLTNAYPSFSSDNLIFCNEKEVEALSSFGKIATTLKLALHELLGHKSGKLLRKESNGTFNFDIENLLNPITNERIDKYYIDNETYESKFTNIARSLEECRADLTALYFSFNKKIHQIFEVSEANNDVIYAMWLIHFRQGILGLALYNEETKKWNDPQAQGAWVFTNYILDKQKKGIEILKVDLDKEKNTFNIVVNKEMIVCYGQFIVAELLKNIQIWKCTGDSESARAFYDKYSDVNEFYLKVKKIASENEIPRRLELYHNLVMKEDKTIELVEYPETYEGIIESFVDRYQTTFNKDIYEQWIRYETNFFLLNK